MLKFIENQDGVRKDNGTVLEITKPLSMTEKSIISTMLQGLRYKYDIDDKSRSILVIYEYKSIVSEIIDDINTILDTKNAKFASGEKHQHGVINTVMIEPIMLPIDDLLEVFHGAALYLSRKHNRKIELSSKGYNTLCLRINLTVKLIISYYQYNSTRVIIQDANPDVAVGFDVCDEFCDTIKKMIH